MTFKDLPSNSNLEATINTFGENVFSLVKKHQSRNLGLKGIATRLMNLTMSFPEIKSNLFRLVDVLPSLSSKAAVVEHINQYLFDPSDRSLPLWIKKLLRTTPGSPIGYLAATINSLAVDQMAQLFIAGRDAHSALPKINSILSQNLAFTVDLLGEYSISESEALAYQQRYIEAISTLLSFKNSLLQSARHNQAFLNSRIAAQQLSVSIKLSALYSQTSILNFERSVDILSERLSSILRLASTGDSAISVYLDAEDTGTNPIILEVFKRVFSSPEFKNFPFPGIVLQAYARDAETTLLDLIEFAKTKQSPIAIRLVKGAYWDHETVQANQNHWPNPLFIIKEDSDANYEKLSRLLLDNHKYILPAFASHNVRSLANACCYADSIGLSKTNFELQMLYGMADPIAKSFRDLGYLVRLYVPLGEMLPGMGYLVRRLLENTSNESFLRHTFYEASEIKDLLKQPQFKGKK